MPANAALTDGQPIETGVKFRSDVDGFVTAIRFYKGVQNTGTHVGHLWIEFVRARRPPLRLRAFRA